MPFRRNSGDRRPAAARRAAGASRRAALAILLLGTGPLHAQIQVGVELEHQAYLTGEPFTVRVRIENQLTVPMVFDSEYHNAELLTELIRSKSGSVPEGERKPVSRDLVIMPGQRAQELVEITSLFPLRDPGGYKVRAAVRYDGRLYLSRQVEFDLVRGVELLDVRRGMPGYHETELVYSLRYWKRGGGEHAFFVIADADTGVIYGTFLLGPVVRVNPPAIRFDEQGRAVVVHQSGRDRFTRSVFEVNRNGATMTGQTHHLADGRQYPSRAAR